ncbi:MAG: SH3 domain-containing protein [Methylophilaceae bacterium]
MRFLRLKASLNPSLKNLSMVLLCLGFSLSAHAEFRSVVVAKAVLFDAPSAEASKVFILNQGYPVEIIVNLGQWLKVRDQLGGLSWIESKNLATKRTVVVTTKTDLKATEEAASSLVATVEKDVVLELLSSTNKNGWVKVKHRDGLTGFVQASDVWGF